MNVHFIRLSCLVLLCAGAALWGCTRPQAIKVGFTGQFVGKFSELGVQGRNGAQLALEQFNAKGGIGGRPLQLVSVDEGNTPEGAIEAMDKLNEEGVFLVIGNMTSSQTIAAQPYAAKLGMTIISPTSSSPLPENKKGNQYRVLSSSEQWSKALGHYAADSGFQTMAGIYDQSNAAYSQFFMDTVIAQFVRDGGVSVGVTAFNSSTPPNWKRLLDMLRETRPGVLVVAASARDTADVAEILHSAGLSIPILCSPWAFTNDLIRYAGALADGMTSAFSLSPDISCPGFAAFKKQYEERFGRTPNFGAVLSYEAMLVATAALEKTGGNALGLNEALATLGPIKGIIGSFNLDTEGDTSRPTYLLRIKDGALKTIGRYGQQ